MGQTGFCLYWFINRGILTIRFRQTSLKISDGWIMLLLQNSGVFKRRFSLFPLNRSTITIFPERIGVWIICVFSGVCGIFWGGVEVWHSCYGLVFFMSQWKKHVILGLYVPISQSCKNLPGLWKKCCMESRGYTFSLTRWVTECHPKGVEKMLQYSS